MSRAADRGDWGDSRSRGREKMIDTHAVGDTIRGIYWTTEHDHGHALTRRPLPCNHRVALLSCPSSTRLTSAPSGVWVACLKWPAGWSSSVLSLLIWHVTRSPLPLALVLVFNNLPRPLCSPFAGLLADRLNRRSILIGAQLLNTFTALGVLSLLMLERIQPWQVFLAVSLQGVVNRWKTRHGARPSWISSVPDGSSTPCPSMC